MLKPASNRIIKELGALSSPHTRRKSPLFLAEGERLSASVPKELIKYYVLPEGSPLSPQYHDLPAYIVSPKIYESVCLTVSPQPIACVCEKFCRSFEDVFLKKPELIVLCESLRDPGNLGSIIRTADAAGASGIILTKGCAELFNPKVLRSAMGSAFNLPIVTGIDIGEALKSFKEKNILTLAAHLKGKKTPYAADLKRPSAILIGNEANGLSEAAAKAADELVKLPMLGKAESLNASVACAVLIYEAVRQRLEI